MRAHDYVLPVAILLLALTTATCFAAFTSNGKGSFRVQLNQREASATIPSECLGGHKDNLKQFLANQSVYKLSIEDQHERIGDVRGRPLACRHPLHSQKLFTGTLQIGTPPQPFEVLFDTGSDNIWVTHTKCRLNGRQWATDLNKGKFAIDRSTSFKRIGREPAKVSYMNNMRFRGWWVEDRVQLVDAHDSTRSLAVPNQPLALICFIEIPEGQSFDLNFDGLVGLGFAWSKQGSPSRPTLLENLHSQGLLDEPVFSFYTNRSIEHLSRATDELIFGQVDKSRHTGPITWTPVVRLPHWEIRAHSIRILDDTEARSGSESPQAFACSHGCQVIVDTGTDAIIGPDAEVARLNEHHLGFVRNKFAPHVWFELGECRQHIANLTKSLVIQVGDTHLEMKPEAFLIESQSTDGQKLCLSAIHSSRHVASKLPADWLFGALFIQNFYTIFDFGQKRMGFATLV